MTSKQSSSPEKKKAYEKAVKKLIDELNRMQPEIDKIYLMAMSEGYTDPEIFELLEPTMKKILPIDSEYGEVAKGIIETVFLNARAYADQRIEG